VHSQSLMEKSTSFPPDISNIERQNNDSNCHGLIQNSPIRCITLILNHFNLLESLCLLITPWHVISRQIISITIILLVLLGFDGLELCANFL